MSEITPRQKEVLALVTDGASNRDIAASLKMSEFTVRRHINMMKLRLGLPADVSRVHLMPAVSGAFRLPTNLHLTPRQRQVLPLIAKGLRHKDIAKQLHISCGASRNCTRMIFEKTGMGSLAELASWYRAHCEPTQ